MSAGSGQLCELGRLAVVMEQRDKADEWHRSLELGEQDADP